MSKKDDLEMQAIVEEIRVGAEALLTDYRRKIEKMLFSKKNKMDKLSAGEKLSGMKNILSKIIADVTKELEAYEEQEKKRGLREHEDYLEYRRCVHGWDC